MLGIGGKFAGAKGMVAVPSLSGLSRSAAQTAITGAGLLFFEDPTPVDTTNSALDGKVTGQSFSPGTLVDYETIISYSYNRYVAPPPSGPTLIPGSPTRIENWVAGTSSQCSGYTKVITPTEQLQISYLYEYTDGNSNTVRAPGEDGQVIYITDDKLYQYNSPDCGYVAPPACVPETEFVSDWLGACINNYQTYAVRYRDTCTGEETVTSTSIYCCNSTTITVSSWTGSCISCYRQTAVRYRDSCTGYEWVERGSEYCCSGGGGTLVAL